MKKKVLAALAIATILFGFSEGSKGVPQAYAATTVYSNLIPAKDVSTEIEILPGEVTTVTIPVQAATEYIHDPKFSVEYSKDAPFQVDGIDVYQEYAGHRSEENHINPLRTSMLTFQITTKETAKIGEYSFDLVYEDWRGYGKVIREGDKDYKQRITFTAKVPMEKMPPELAISNLEVSGVLAPGGEATLSFRVTNVGEITAKDIRLSGDYSSNQMVPNYTDYTRRLGDLFQGASSKVTLKVKILKNVMQDIILLPLDITYKDIDGTNYTADSNNIIYLEIVLPDEDKKDEKFEMGTLLINNVKQSPTRPKAGEKVTLSFDMENTGEKDYTETKLYLDYVSNTGFEPVKAEPYQFVGTIKAGQKKRVTVDVIAGKEMVAGLNTLRMDYKYKDGNAADAGDGVELYVLNVQALEKEDNAISRPKLMVSEFNTSLETIKSGEEFDFSFKVYNTHADTSAKNIKITVTSETFSVTKGSNSFFLSKIEPEQSEEITLNLKASAAAMTGSYPINIQMEYEFDGMPVNEANAGGVVVTETKMVLIKENLRVSVENVMVGGWNTPYVNQPTQLSFSIYNMGKSMLNNVFFTVEGDFTVANGSSYYYGTLQAGYPDYVEMDITPLVEGDATGTLTIHMEDSNGDEVTYTSDISGFIMGMSGEDIGFEDPGFDIPVDVPVIDNPVETKKPIVSVPIFAVILVVVFLASLFTARGIRIACYKRKLRKEEQE